MVFLIRLLLTAGPKINFGDLFFTKIVGVSSPRIFSSDGHPLRGAREIRVKVHVDQYREDYQASSMFPIWAQFTYNDLIYTPISSGMKM